MMIFKSIKYWWYRNSPFIISLRLHTNTDLECGDVLEFIADSLKVATPKSKKWVYCGNNVVCLLKVK